MEIRPRVQGYIEQILVDDGDQVQQGQVLFKLDSGPYQQNVRSAQANVQAAQADISAAKTEVERLEPLVRQKILSKFRLQTARDQLKTKEAALAQAQAALANAETDLSYTTIVSPASGVVGSINYKVGALVDSTINPPLTTVSDISKVYAYFSMSERQLLEMTRVRPAQGASGGGPQLSLQQRVAKMPPAKLVLPDNTVYDHTGKISLASGLIQQSTGAASFQALFPNPNQILRTGGSATVRIPFRRASAITVPKKATYEIQNKRFVYTVTKNNTVKSTPIETLPLSTEQSYVVTKGLSAGDTIVTAGMQQLRDGMKIRPTNQ